MAATPLATLMICVISSYTLSPLPGWLWGINVSQFPDQHALCHVARKLSVLIPSGLPSILSSCRHASIDHATRAARGLPEDLIHLCVGIENLGDLLDDLEHALFEAGSIELSVSNGQRYVRVKPRTLDPISRAVEKLAEDLSSVSFSWSQTPQGEWRVAGQPSG